MFRKDEILFCGSRFAVVYLVICVAFLVLLYGAYSATLKTKTSILLNASRETRSNGTHEFGATTILISLDGFRAVCHPPILLAFLETWQLTSSFVVAGLHPPQPHTFAFDAGPARHISKMDAPIFPFSNFPKPLYARHGPVSGIPWYRSQFFFRSRAAEVFLLYRSGEIPWGGMVGCCAADMGIG